MNNKATMAERYKSNLRKWADEQAPNREKWIERNAYFYEQDHAYLKFLVPKDARILDLGCGTGKLLAALNPSSGVGVDISPEMIAIARDAYPNLTFVQGDVEDPEALAALDGPFDVIVMSDTLGFLHDCENTLKALHPLCSLDTRIVISYYSHLWEPVLTLAEKLGQRMPGITLNWLAMDDIVNSLHLTDFEPIKREWRLLVPKKLFGLGSLINRYVATLPILRRLCLRHYLVAHLPPGPASSPPSASVVIPCRNEMGNIEPAVIRMPRFCEDLEVIYVEGHSQDGTWDEIQRVAAAYPSVKIKALQQTGKGKGDAVRAAFDAASGDILMILDADLTVPPEDMPKFYDAISSGKAEFVNGTRMVYPMEGQAMRYLNYWANRVFAVLFSYLLNQRFTDTLCGTKALSRSTYRKIENNRQYFGDFDPFGDFDLIFGAAKLNQKIVEVPVRYSDRQYGTTQISRFRHGWLLLRMVLFAYRKLKAI